MANFYSNLNLKRNQLLLPVIHPSGGIPDGTNVQGQLYFRNDAGNEQLFLCTATADDGTWVPLYNNITALTNGGLTVAGDGVGQEFQTISLGLSNLLAITDNAQSLDAADVMGVHDITASAPRKVTMTQLKAFTNSGLTSNVSTSLSTGTVDGSTYGITSDGGTDDVIIAAATTSAAGVLTSAKFDEIAANTLKNTNVSTALSTGTVDGGTYGITSDGGTDDVIIAAATTSAAGVLTSAKFDEIAANTLKNTNVSTALSTGTVDGGTYGITSDGGTDDVIIAAATTSAAGVLTSAKFDEIAANTLKNTNVSTALSTGTVDGSTYGITSDGGTDDVIIAAATTSAAGVMTSTMFDANADITNKANKASPAFTGDSTHSDASPSYVMTDTSNDTTGGIFRFVKDPADESSNDGDSIGTLSWVGYNNAAAPEAHEYGTLQTVSTSTAEDSEQSAMRFAVMAGGTLTQGLSINGTTSDGRVNITLGADADSTTTVVGNLTVSGTTTTVNTATLDVADNEITLNSDWANNTTPTQAGGIKVYRGDVGVSTYGAGSDEMSLGKHPARLFYYEPGDGTVGKWQMDQGDDSLVDIGSSADTMGSGFIVLDSDGANQGTIIEGEKLKFVASTGALAVSVADDVSNPVIKTVTITSPNDDNQNAYSTSIPTSTTKLRLTGTGQVSTTDDIEFVGGGATTVTRTNDSKFTISSTDNNDDNQNAYSTSIPTSTTKLRLTGTGQVSTTDDVEFVGGGATTVTRTNDSKFTISSTDNNDQNAYSTSIPTSTTKLRLTGTGQVSTTDDVEFVGGGATTVTRTNDSKFTISSTDNNDNTQLSNAVAIIDVSALTTSGQFVSNITHGLGSHDISVQLWETTAGAVPYTKIDADIERTDSATIKVTFGTIPPNDVRVVMIAENTSDLADTEVLYPN